MKIFSDDLFRFDFIIDPGESELTQDALKDESSKLIKYFLASLTVPEKEMWVNLSPYEKNRIIPDVFGRTAMGRELLVQDYFLKQLTASLMYPEQDLGEKFWKRVNQEVFKKYGKNVPINTFNKIWIVPERAKVFIHNNTVFIEDYHLKVLLEQDYLALEVNKNRLDQGVGGSVSQDVSLSIVREVLIPQIEKEVNEGRTFAPLRQIFCSMILATWYKQNLKENLLSKNYADQSKISGLDTEDKDGISRIYKQYLKTFEQGAYDFVKENYDAETQEVVSRRYFSGGVDAATLSSVVTEDKLENELDATARIKRIFSEKPDGKIDKAMIGSKKSIVGPVVVGVILTGRVSLNSESEVRENVFWDSTSQNIIKIPEYWFDKIEFRFWYPVKKRNLFSLTNAIIKRMNVDIKRVTESFAFTPTGKAILLVPEKQYMKRLSDFYLRQVLYAQRVQKQVAHYSDWVIPEKFRSWSFDYSKKELRNMKESERLRVVSQAIEFMAYYFSNYGFYYNMILGYRSGEIPVPYVILRPRLNYQDVGNGEMVSFLPNEPTVIRYKYYELGSSIIKTPPQYSVHFRDMESAYTSYMDNRKFLERQDEVEDYVDGDIKYYQSVLGWYPDLFSWSDIDLSLKEEGIPIKLARQKAFIQFLLKNKVNQLPLKELRDLFRSIVIEQGRADEKVHMYDSQQAQLPFDIALPTRYDRNMSETRSTVGKVLLTRRNVHYRLNIDLDNYEDYFNDDLFEKEHGEDTVFTVNRLGYWFWKNPDFRQRLGDALKGVDTDSLEDVKEFLALTDDIQREIILQLPLLSEEELISLHENIWRELQSTNNPIKDGYDLKPAESVFRTKEEQAKNDKAMGPEKVGGVDLNPQNMDLKVEGQGLQISVPENFFPNVEIHGLTPVIINVVPLNYQFLLGESKDVEKTIEVSHL